MIEVRAARARIRYPIRIESGLLGRAGRLLRQDGVSGTVLVVTDRTVARLHGPRFLGGLRKAGLTPRVIALPPGERSKTLARVRDICERWSRWSANRTVPVVAFGGGVVSDVAGFAAASYARGLDWFVFPTTLLAQADASIGGKVGVNLASAKNLLGAFHHPRAIHADVDTLRTLPPRAFRSGLAEIVKMGVIRRPSVLESLRSLAAGGVRPEDARVAELIRAAAKEKAWYVSRDPNDVGLRQALNFGHTV
jgi:3-dehydroquinate synthase